MKCIYRLPFFSAAILFSSNLFADATDREHNIDVDDIKVIREWLNTKRQVTIKEKGGALSISGEVHTEFQTSNEKRCGIQQRGPHGATDLANKSFDVEADFAMDYRTDRTWAAIKLKFDNNAGVFSGTKDKIALDRAYLGARLYESDNAAFDVELGRRGLSNIFDSKIEFDNRFDGILLSYDIGIENVGNFYTHVGAFIIDERENHYGYIGEVGLLGIANTGFYTKYSLIDWATHPGPNDVVETFFVEVEDENGTVIQDEVVDIKISYFRVKKRFDFVISQFILGYRYFPQKLNKIVILYIAGLYNHKAPSTPLTHHHRYPWGGYVGFSIGELKKANDWSFDINYQIVQPQAIPDFDVAGVGLGNAISSGFYTVFQNGTGGKTTSANAGGNSNYRGYQITLQYLLTNNITLFQSFQDSMTLIKSVGPFRRFKQYEIEFIYGF